MFQILDVIGVFVFTVSGVLSGLNKKLDAFGVFIIAFVTALGGGTLRDMLIGKTPVGWMEDLTYLYIIVLAYFITIFFKRHLEKLRISLFLFDSIGLGVFTIIGIEKGIKFGLHPIICIALGTITASFGGVIRDILCNEIPVIFRKEIYATVCIFGGIMFFVLQKINLNHDVLYVITSLFMISFRLLAVKYKWYLPSLYKKG
ncbi:trimeric intracellular cation channel family protein [uncultured Flavobacterium sp.]|uniref:trimeric intracellular cation channel family protein n=1 Tax=uncultured Flavobacterium sp. TaxID=165435 RepID=UPI0030EE724C|tara:strand:- start:111491 stop:112096 length:606 start_codon:yes stop_codon:yes gene_type:complete